MEDLPKDPKIAGLPSFMQSQIVGTMINCDACLIDKAEVIFSQPPGREQMSKLIRTCLIGIAPIALLAMVAEVQAQDDVDCVRCVDTSDIARTAVTSGKIAPKAIGTGKLKSQAVTKGKIAPGAVTTGKIKSGAVTNAKLAPEVRNQIAALSERVDALEAANVGINGGDLDGNIYCAQGIGREYVGGEAPGLYVSNYGGVLTFISSTQVAVLDLGENEAFLNTNTGINGTATDPGGGTTMHSYFVTGNTLTIPTLLPPGLSLIISPDGNFLFGIVSSVTDSNHDSDLVIAVRADGC